MHRLHSAPHPHSSLTNRAPFSFCLTLIVACAGEDTGDMSIGSSSEPTADSSVISPMPSETAPGSSVTPPEPSATVPAPSETIPTSSATAPEPSATVPAPSMTVPVPTAAPTSDPVPAPTVDLEDVPSYGEVYYMINLTCANVVCHVPGYFMPDLSDANNDQYDILMNTYVEQCGGAPLVKPGDPDGSAIIMVTHQQCAELAMPKDCTDPVCIAPEKVEMLRTWIAAGAPRD